MSGRAGKRKRSLHDSTVDRSKIRKAFEALKEELDGIEETEELKTILEHVLTLETILKGAKKPRVPSESDFSTITSEDLRKTGVTRKCLYFDPAKVIQLAKGWTSDAEAEIVDLYSRVKKIYARVNMDYDAGSRMVLNAILLALAEIISDKQRSVAILPEMRIAQGAGVPITHPVSGYELWLSGSVDYVVIEYEDVEDYKDRLLAPGGSREDTFNIANDCLLLVQAKYQSSLQSLASYIPVAVSQAIALLKSTSLSEVRFCLSDGQTWIFFILKLENGTLTYYESATRRLSKDALENSDMPLREIVQLVCEWLRPTMTGLFELEE